MNMVTIAKLKGFQTSSCIAELGVTRFSSKSNLVQDDSERKRKKGKPEIMLAQTLHFFLSRQCL